MLISGVTKLTLIDFPGKTACIVFTAGCNFRCGYCHNPEFVLPERLKEIAPGFIPEEVMLGFLKRRQGMLEGVVITGGEPTLHPDLEAFIRKVRALGYAIKLDTNGNRPDVIHRLISEGLLDYVAMDFKIDHARYPGLVGPGADPEKIRESFDMLKEGRVPYEFRTTLVREIHTDEVLADMKREIHGAARYFLQPFRPGIVLHPSFAGYHPFSREEMQGIADGFSSVVEEIGIREA